jgi:TPR repeat protein
MYEQVEGTTQDYKQAFKWYSKAAEQGNVQAQFNLALMYYKGNGTKQNYILAHMFFNIASLSGNDKAGKSRDKLSQKMTPEQVIEAQKMAKEWVKKH